MTITIKLKTDNAAFEDKEAEVTRIVHEVAEKLQRYGSEFTVSDSNGNKVGTVKVTGK